jgi:2-aminobenzoate-CoA ligase
MNATTASRTAHVDTFGRDNLPPRDLWPLIDTSAPPLSNYPERMNCAVELLDKMVASGHRDRPCVHFGDKLWTYGDLLDRANRVAEVLTQDMGLVAGNRVMLRAPNNPALLATWFGVIKAGGIVVATMPLLRARELTYNCQKAQITHALCDIKLAEEMVATKAACPDLKHVAYFTALLDGSDPKADFDRAALAKSGTFANVDTYNDDVVLIAFTSGTTGPAKGTMHFHRDVLAMCDVFPKQCLNIQPNDIFCGSPPLAFTFGLGALALFPMRYGASLVMLERSSPDILLESVQKYKVTGLVTAPTGYRQMIDVAKKYDLSSLRIGVSAGETLPKATWQGWYDATGVKIVDGIGATEMIHIFISAPQDQIRPGATGKPLKGYEAKVVDENGDEVPPGTMGRLAVRGCTGCRYLDNLERQKSYVKNGWNMTGDLYTMHADGYFWYGARGDDMIVSAGYNISGPEVEAVLLEHPKVKECAVIGAPDDQRGIVVKAYVVLRDPAEANDATIKLLQDFVKSQIAPYKYPRLIEFRDTLPRTETGKLQRFRLRDDA